MSKKNNHQLYISLSVDWEGESFNGVKDLLRMRSKVEKFMRREVPLTHFICPAYYTNGVSRPTQNIHSVYRPDLDEVACHVHCWQSIIKEARVKFRVDHDFHAGTSRAGSGHGVPFGVYGEETKAILDLSTNLLEYHLDCQVESFRCGGALTSDAVFRALFAAGFKTDSSACPPCLYSRGYNYKEEGSRLDGFGEDNGLLTTYKMALWGHERNCSGAPHLSNTIDHTARAGQAITGLSQPYKITAGEKTLVEIPVNGGMSDYVNTNRTVWPTFEKLLRQCRAGRGPLYFHLACHQEGDAKYKQPFLAFFEKLASRIHRDQSITQHLQWLTVAEASALFSEC